VLPVGDELVLAGNSSTGAGSGAETVLVTTAGPGSPLREIGTATGLHPSSEPGRVWLETQLMPPDEPRTLLRLVDLQGAQHRDADHDGIHGFSPQFSSDSRWAFWPDVTGRSVNALDVVTGRPFRVAGDFASVEAVVVLPQSAGQFLSSRQRAEITPPPPARAHLVHAGATWRAGGGAR
jgi:hypothetical protein